ncbi:MAG TPA: two-component regulator propeller domain-containing protein, partial [Verrucomicrobiae bacterium]|nr:two-component regulator propeller domain-containing protein [Verrucomicrobiae bacterium]
MSVLFACHAIQAAPIASASDGAHAKARLPLHRLWKPVPDEMYLQEVGQQIPTANPVTALAIQDGILYVVTGRTVKRLAGSTFEDAPGAPEGIQRMKSFDGVLWSSTGQATYRCVSNSWQQVDPRPFQDFCSHLGETYGATRDAIFRFESGKFVNTRPAQGYLSNDETVMTEDFQQVLVDPVQIGPINRIASYSGTLYLLRPGGLALLEGKTFVPDPVDWGTLPSPITRDLLAQGSRLYVATDRGLGVLRGMALTSLRGAEGLPFEDVTCLAEGFEGDLWIGTSRGAIRNAGNEFHYFGAQHWLPNDYVRAIVADSNSVYIATDGGLGIIRYQPFTLRQKAENFERQLDDWGFKRLGFIHKLYWGGDK